MRDLRFNLSRDLLSNWFTASVWLRERHLRCRCYAGAEIPEQVLHREPLAANDRLATNMAGSEVMRARSGLVIVVTR